MKKKIFTVLMAAILVCGIGMASVVTNAPSDLYSESYASPIAAEQGFRNVQDAVPAVAILALPDATAYTHTYTYTYDVATTSYVCSITNVSYSAYAPLSWATTNWPIANSDGVTYGMAIITNPPTRSYAYGAATNTMPISNLWINATGTSAGWNLVQ